MMANGTNPFVGPRPFAAGEQLYGRDREQLDLLDLLIAERIVLLYSPSGAGKTSLVQAGLVPKLESEGFRVLPVMRVNAQPPSSIVHNRHLFSALRSLDEVLPDKALAEVDLDSHLKRSPRKPEEPENDVLIFDQFEEILTVDPTNREAKERFFAEVGVALRDRSRWALFSMREDYLAGLDPYLRPMPTRLSNTFRLDLLAVNEACLAMQKPSRSAGVDFSDGAARKLADNLRRVRVQRPDGAMEDQFGLYIEPVQLQVVCRRLWERLDGASQIVEKDIEALGDIDRSLAEYYAEQVQATAAKTGMPERTIREWFEHQLITQQGIRSQVLKGQGLAVSAVQNLEDAHLVRSESRRGASWCELAHDRLIEPVRKNNAEWVGANLSALQRQAALWESQNRPSGLLLRDHALVEAERWAAAHRAELTPVESDLLAACVEARRIAERERRQARRVLWLAVGASVVSVIALLLFAWALKQRHEALTQKGIAEGKTREAESQRRIAEHQTTEAYKQRGIADGQRIIANEQTKIATTQKDIAEQRRIEADRARLDAERETRIATVQRLAAQADNMLARFPQLSLLLAVEGAKASLRENEPIVPEAEQSLRQALATVGGSGFGGAGMPVTSVAVSPNGRWLAMGETESAYVSDLTVEGPPLPSLLYHLDGGNSQTAAKRYLPELVFTRDGRFLVATTVGVATKVWDMSGGVPMMTPLSWPLGTAQVAASSTSADGRWLLSLAADGSLVLWDLVSEGGASRPFLLSPGAPIHFVDTRGNGFPNKMDRQEMLAGLLGPIRVNQFQTADPSQGKLYLSVWGFPVVSPDGRWMVTAEDDGLHLSDLKASDPTSTFLAAGGPLDFPQVVFSGNSRRLVIATQDGAARVWDLTALDPRTPPLVVRTHREGTGIARAALSPDGSWLFTASQVNRLDVHRRPGTSAWLWDLRLPDPSAKPFELKGHEAGLGAIATTPDGRWAVTGSDAGVVRLWDLTSDDPAAAPLILRGHERGIANILPTSDGRWLVTHGVDGSVRVWDLRTLQPTTSPIRLRASSAGIPVGAISPDSRWLATAGRDDAGHLWDLQAPSPAATPIALQPKAPLGSLPWLGFSPDGHWLVTGSEFGPARLFDLTARLIPETARTLDKGEGTINVLAMSPDSHWLAMSRAYWNTESRLWDLRDPRASFEPLLLRGTSIVMSSDSHWIAGVSSDVVRLWDLTAKDPSITAVDLHGHTKRISACRFTTDSHWLVTASDDHLQVWDLTARARAVHSQVFEGPTEGVYYLDMSPDGRWLVTGGKSTLRLWDLRVRPGAEAVSQVLTNHWSTLEKQTFTPDSQWLITIEGDHNDARLWSLRAKNPLQSPFLLRGHEHGVGLVVVSPDSHWLATGGHYDITSADDRTVRLWNLASKDPSSSPFVLLGHERGRPHVKITEDSRWLITGSEDATLRFWDLQADNPATAPLVAPASDKIAWLYASPDGRFVVSAGEDGIVQLWHMRPSDLIALAQAASGRNMSLEEWNRFFQGQRYRKTFPFLPGPQIAK